MKMASKPLGKGVTTRRGCSGNQLSLLVGPGKDFLPTEVPTVRAVLQRGLLMQEENLHKDVPRHLYPISELARDLVPLVVAQWEKSNMNFKPPVIYNYKSISRKIVKEWTNYHELHKVNEKAKEERIKELDTLFDILTCKHLIYLCVEETNECHGTSVGAHISCNCPSDAKIPKVDLFWVYFQRNRQEIKITNFHK